MSQLLPARVTRAVGILAGAVLLAGCASAGGAPPRERYLQGAHTYRGRVIDAETKAPLAGAAVVAVWYREKFQFIQTSDVFHEAREVLTNANGDFILDAEELERTAPAWTLPPFLTIFFPGYGSFPSYQVAPKGYLRGIFEGAGVTVELPRLKTREERREHLSRISPYSLSDDPFKDIPNFVRLVNIEEVSLGFKPYPPPERRP